MVAGWLVVGWSADWLARWLAVEWLVRELVSAGRRVRAGIGVYVAALSRHRGWRQYTRGAGLGVSNSIAGGVGDEVSSSRWQLRSVAGSVIGSVIVCGSMLAAELVTM